MDSLNEDDYMSEIYAITDLRGYVSQMRDAAANSLCDNHSEDLDNYISIDQMIGLVKQECVGFDDNDRPLLNEETNANIFDKTAVWIHNVGLARLAAQDLVECAWDDNENEMIFWAKQERQYNVEPDAQPKQKNEEIKKLKEEIASLKEYLLSDCCRQCDYIVNKIEEYQKEIERLTHEYIG